MVFQIWRPLLLKTQAWSSLQTTITWCLPWALTETNKAELGELFEGILYSPILKTHRMCEEWLESTNLHIFQIIAYDWLCRWVICSHGWMHGKACKGRGRNPWLVNWFLDKKDAKSNGNLWKHARLCWGNKTIQACDNTKDIRAAQSALWNQLKYGSVLAAFERVRKGKVTYSHCQHTKTKIKVCFCCAYPF